MSRTSVLLLRIALASAFLYAAYGFWSNPSAWIGFVPELMRTAELGEQTLLAALAIFHLAMALWILSGWLVAVSSVAAAAFFVFIVYFNQEQLDILFRDVSLALAALALAFSRRR